MNRVFGSFVAAVVSCVFVPSVGATDSAPAAVSTRVLGAVGIGVKDLESSTRFYGDVLGMKVLRRFELGYLNEVVLGFPDGMGTNIVDREATPIEALNGTIVGLGRDPDNYVIELLAR